MFQIDNPNQLGDLPIGGFLSTVESNSYLTGTLSNIEYLSSEVSEEIITEPSEETVILNDGTEAIYFTAIINDGSDNISNNFSGDTVELTEVRFLFSADKVYKLASEPPTAINPLAFDEYWFEPDLNKILLGNKPPIRSFSVRGRKTPVKVRQGAKRFKVRPTLSQNIIDFGRSNYSAGKLSFYASELFKKIGRKNCGERAS